MPDKDEFAVIESHEAIGSNGSITISHYKYSKTLQVEYNCDDIASIAQTCRLLSGSKSRPPIPPIARSFFLLRGFGNGSMRFTASGIRAVEKKKPEHPIRGIDSCLRHLSASRTPFKQYKLHIRSNRTPSQLARAGKFAFMR
ncbi:hypothetical protein [Methylomonas methanica]|uniref:hypothetical protein n=1 Tax=Methylomonas methanica TaxID=421 RepID=UPI0011D1ABA1|nr:hypothetical protein [Methylomonas methanica]